MRNVNFVIIMIVAILAVANLVLATRGGQQVAENEYKEISDITGVITFSLGKFAVSAYNARAQKQLTLDHVVDCFYENNAWGTNYKFHLKVTSQSPTDPLEYLALVLEERSGKRTLASFDVYKGI